MNDTTLYKSVKWQEVLYITRQCSTAVKGTTWRTLWAIKQHEQNSFCISENQRTSTCDVMQPPLWGLARVEESFAVQNAWLTLSDYSMIFGPLLMLRPQEQLGQDWGCRTWSLIRKMAWPFKTCPPWTFLEAIGCRQMRCLRRNPEGFLLENGWENRSPKENCRKRDGQVFVCLVVGEIWWFRFFVGIKSFFWGGCISTGLRVALWNELLCQVTKLTPLTPEVISRQATMNVPSVKENKEKHGVSERVGLADEGLGALSASLKNCFCIRDCWVRTLIDWQRIRGGDTASCSEVGTIGHVAHGKSTATRCKQISIVPPTCSTLVLPEYNFVLSHFSVSIDWCHKIVKDKMKLTCNGWTFLMLVAAVHMIFDIYKLLIQFETSLPVGSLKCKPSQEIEWNVV